MPLLIRRLGVMLAVIAALTSILPRVRAQEFDTVISSHSRQAYTIADQTEDPQERRALGVLFAPSLAAAEKARLAEEFLGSFPRSWFLPQVLEIGAKAFIDLGQYTKALRYGGDSLDLLPENPLLLVPLANAQIQLSHFGAARVSARLALQYLDELAPPLSIADWPTTSRELKASAYFVLGRIGVTEALLSYPGGKAETTSRRIGK